MRSKKLNVVFDKFTSKMRKRLNKKEHEGFTGWDNIELYDDFINRATKKLNNIFADEKTFVDVANLAMFLAYIVRNKK